MSATLYPVRPEVAANTFTDEATYKAMYQQSVINPDGFWREQAKRLDWMTPFTKVKQTSFDDHHVDIKWFADGTLNVSANCLDRHLAERGDQIAIVTTEMNAVGIHRQGQRQVVVDNQQRPESVAQRT